MCVCVCVCIYIYVYIHIHRNTYIHIYVIRVNPMLKYRPRITCPMIAVPNCSSTCVYADSADAQSRLQ